jgi:hypothetical protein
MAPQRLHLGVEVSEMDSKLRVTEIKWDRALSGLHALDSNRPSLSNWGVRSDGEKMERRRWKLPE